MKEIAQAFLKAQSQMSNPVKGSNNPFFNRKYADLNSVREATITVLNEHGISVLQPMVTVDGKNYIKTVLLHESGETIESLTEIVYSKQNDAQAQGSGITYARRYGLQSLVCVGADDDDGKKASVQPKKQELPLLDVNGAKWGDALKAVTNGTTIENIKKYYKLTKDAEKELTAIQNQV